MKKTVFSHEDYQVHSFREDLLSTNCVPSLVLVQGIRQPPRHTQPPTGDSQPWELGRLMLNHREMTNIEMSDRHLQERSRVMNRPQLAALGDSHKGSL